MYSNVATAKACTLSFLNSLAKQLSARVQIILIWMMGLTFALSPLFGWSYYAPEDSGIRYVHLTGPFFHLILFILGADWFLYTLNFNSCAPVWGDPSGASYIIYLLVVGWGIPNLIIILSAIEVLRYQRKVHYGTSYIIKSIFKLNLWCL